MKITKKCLICEKKNSVLLLKKKKQPTKIFPQPNFTTFKIKDLSLYVCYSCRHVFQHPIPTNKEIDTFYKDEQSHYVSLIKNPELGGSEKEKIDYIKKVILKFKHKPSLVEIGGFDGYLIYKLKKFLAKSLLIEPNKEGTIIAKKYKIKSINKYLNLKLAKTLQNKFDIVVSRHVIEHVPDLKDFVKCLSLLVKPNGIIIIETPNMDTILKDITTRAFIHQHIHYFSTFSLNKIFNKLQLFKKKVLIGNSIIVCFKNYSEQNNKNNIKKIKFENISYYKKLVKNYNIKLKKKIEKLHRIIKKQPKNFYWIYGASSVVNDLFSVYNLRKDLVKGIIDLDKKKINYRLPVCKNIPIFSIDNLKKVKKDLIIIATNNKNDAIKILDKYKHEGKRFFL